VRARGLGPAQRVAKRAFAVFEPGDRARVGEAVLGMPLAKGPMPSVSACGGFREGDVGVLDDEHESSAFSAGGVVQARAVKCWPRRTSRGAARGWGAWVEGRAGEGEVLRRVESRDEPRRACGVRRVGCAVRGRGVCGHGLASSFYIWRMRLAGVAESAAKIEWDESRPPRRSRPAMNSCQDDPHARGDVGRGVANRLVIAVFGGAVMSCQKRRRFAGSRQRPASGREHASSTTMTHSRRHDHAAWLACQADRAGSDDRTGDRNPDGRAGWRKVEAIAPATPAWSRGMPKVQYWYRSADPDRSGADK